MFEIIASRGLGKTAAVVDALRVLNSSSDVAILTCQKDKDNYTLRGADEDRVYTVEEFLELYNSRKPLPFKKLIIDDLSFTVSRLLGLMGASLIGFSETPGLHKNIYEWLYQQASKKENN